MQADAGGSALTSRYTQAGLHIEAEQMAGDQVHSSYATFSPQNGRWDREF